MFKTVHALLRDMAAQSTGAVVLFSGGGCAHVDARSRVRAQCDFCISECSGGGSATAAAGAYPPPVPAGAAAGDAGVFDGLGMPGMAMGMPGMG